MTPPPPLVLAWLAADLPATPDARAEVVRRLDAAARARGHATEGGRVTRSPEAQTAYDTRRALYVWAHGEAVVRPGAQGPTLAAWGAVLGVSREAVHNARRRDPATAALPVANEGRPRVDDPSPGTARVRAKRRRDARGEPPPPRGRPKKNRAKTP